jgi:hypothetical protein
MTWLKNLLDRWRAKRPPEPAPPQIGDPKVEADHSREENLQKREKAMENGEGRKLEDV